MFGLSKLKVWTVAAVGILIAAAVFIAKVFSAGKESAQLDSLKEAERQRDEHDSRIAAGHDAGNAARVQPFPNDPYDRANRR